MNQIKRKPGRPPREKEGKRVNVIVEKLYWEAFQTHFSGQASKLINEFLKKMVVDKMINNK